MYKLSLAVFFLLQAAIQIGPASVAAASGVDILCPYRASSAQCDSEREPTKKCSIPWTFACGIDDDPPQVCHCKPSGTTCQSIVQSHPCYWPPMTGCKDPPTEVTVAKNAVFCRFGSATGGYAAPKGTSFPQCALPGCTDSGSYTCYRVIKENCKARRCTADAWFGQPGGADQYKFYPPLGANDCFELESATTTTSQTSTTQYTLPTSSSTTTTKAKAPVTTKATTTKAPVTTKATTTTTTKAPVTTKATTTTTTKAPVTTKAPTATKAPVTTNAPYSTYSPTSASPTSGVTGSTFP